MTILCELHNSGAMVIIGAVFSVRLRQKTSFWGATVMTDVLSAVLRVRKELV
jgi:hypothetical protein